MTNSWGTPEPKKIFGIMSNSAEVATYFLEAAAEKSQKIGLIGSYLRNGTKPKEPCAKFAHGSFCYKKKWRITLAKHPEYKHCYSLYEIIINASFLSLQFKKNQRKSPCPQKKSQKKSQKQIIYKGMNVFSERGSLA